jgi:hypothetical protein
MNSAGQAATDGLHKLESRDVAADIVSKYWYVETRPTASSFTATASSSQNKRQRANTLAERTKSDQPIWPPLIWIETLSHFKNSCKVAS